MDKNTTWRNTLAATITVVVLIAYGLWIGPTWKECRRDHSRRYCVALVVR